jgi:hypothetical protein
MQKESPSTAQEARSFLAALDKPLLIVVIGFMLAMPWSTFGVALLPGWMVSESKAPHDTLAEAYGAAIARAAIRQPGDARPLRVLREEKTSLVHLTHETLARDQRAAQNDMWLSHPDDLRLFCAGAADPLLKMQQALGLPPRRGERRVYTVTVMTKDLQRPCFSGHGPGDGACEIELPKILKDEPKAGATPAEVEAHAKQRAEALTRVGLIAMQSFRSWRVRHPDKWAQPGEYPFDGFPFTGMGWTWNWDPAAPHPVGVSEFVAPKGTAVTIDTAKTPAEFCGGRV